ncbi:hypothetical protein [Streptomyces poriferorum]|uniref:Leucine rich repeat variant n=1 Tax=Streptomyces poriferorum TaxID=2798799 RepID=A0ABY9IGS6_9ACTN|nr:MULTISPECIES: hypothetical protein [unclassified Streptomyces]MDP5315699.1 hypothetical protein [Streptomyces sp. Alt4]WLQ54064.1 hypothetical protein P8A19_00720 [Streptomyces sp. Alt2]
MDAELSTLAAQEDLPPDLVWRLLQHPTARRSVALRRRDLTGQMIEEIIKLGSARSLAANTSVPADVRARLAEHPEPSVRCGVAASVADEPPGLLARLVNDPDPSVRSFLAMNDCLSPELLARLASDPEPSVRSSVIQHWRDAPDWVRRALLTDADANVRRDSVSAYSPPADLLPGLLADPATRAAAVPYAAPVLELATDPDSAVREATAAHPDLPTDLRDLLAEDPDISVRDAIAARPDTPLALRERIVTSVETDSPLAEWILSFRRNPHTCPTPAPAPPILTRVQAEALLATAAL